MVLGPILWYFRCYYSWLPWSDPNWILTSCGCPVTRTLKELHQERKAKDGGH